MIKQQPDIDSTAVFEQLWGITNELRHKLDAYSKLHPEPSTKDLQEYSSSDGNVKGSLNTFSGREIDWLVHTWLRNPKKSNFSTMRLTVWLKSHVRVPHLTFEFGTIPNIFFYMDYIPRTDLLTDPEYLALFYEPVNETYLKLQADPSLSSFTSKSVYIRQFQSPISLCYTCSATDYTLNLIQTVAHEMLERWLTWLKEAEPVPEDMRAALAERDLFVCRTSAECDPGNKFAVQMFGTELTNKLIQALWGSDRIG